MSKTVLKSLVRFLEGGDKNVPSRKKTSRWDGTPAANGAGARRQAGLMAHISMGINGGGIGHN